MTDLVEELSKLAEKATSGPWENSQGFVRTHPSAGLGTTYGNERVTIQTSCQWIAECRDGEAFYNWQANAAYIAALYPERVKKLLAVVRASEAYVEAEWPYQGQPFPALAKALNEFKSS